LGDRAKMIENNVLDWGMAETLAYGSLLEDRYFHNMRF
jgi:2-oxoglutarate dehydrogenase complex dehydrogenase (E1) component-like enzyme